VSTSKIIRQRIWSKLADVAKPDTRFHMNFGEVIPDFEGSEKATDRIAAMDAYKNTKYAFITPDNCLVDLRRRLIERGVPKGAELYAAWLDGMEHFARPVTLEEVTRRGSFDFMVTGASAVSKDGVRFGKGHGFFDLEWGMFTDMGIVDDKTPVVAAVHDVQVVEDKLIPSETDILVDYIATPTRLIEVEKRGKRPHGVKWDLLEPEQIAATPPIQELRRIRGLA
jgi:5-formyltetrahydrofolate cyclo-ligase